ncbi:UNVERIFIED_CONTAM: hypothetical protein GTU68_052147 [Idotea baltica]|nr:hypothetical protein [Idotea baltica]
MKKQWILGLTGGIGSGKSVAANYFKELGVNLVDADIVAREVVDKSQSTLKKIAQHFGNHFIKSNGQLDRLKLRQHIFSLPKEKEWLEALLHPLIRLQIQKQLTETTGNYCILISPLLIESKQHLLTQRILLIDSPEELQVQRVTKRDHIPVDQILPIMQSQFSREQRKTFAHDILLNDNNLENLQLKVQQLHSFYINLSVEL